MQRQLKRAWGAREEGGGVVYFLSIYLSFYNKNNFPWNVNQRHLSCYGEAIIHIK